jgi:hypothetical protein
MKRPSLSARIVSSRSGWQRNALRQKSREVRFDSAAEMLDFFRLPKEGFHYHRLVKAFKRVLGATIFFGTEDR